MRWQNLPPHFLYPLLIPHIVKLCLKYKAPISIITKSNTIFPYGGLPFAPKHKMFKPFVGILEYTLVPAKMSFNQKLKLSRAFARKVKYPLIVKPNIGHRGIDVHLIKSEKELIPILTHQKWDYLLQEYCDYDYEFGIFYCRPPDEKEGGIISLTQKIIPIITGDGKKTLNELIIKSNIENKCAILNRHSDKLGLILPKGKRFKTLVTASHCQGAMFFDAKTHITKMLTDKVDSLCNIDGFHFGRLDVKAKSLEALKKGDFKIIEVNGATSESIHVYDNTCKFSEGIRDLKKQWDLLFKIANHNRLKNENSMTMREFLKEYVRFFLLTRRVTGKLW